MAGKASLERPGANKGTRNEWRFLKRLLMPRSRISGPVTQVRRSPRPLRNRHSYQESLLPRKGPKPQEPLKPSMEGQTAHGGLLRAGSILPHPKRGVSLAGHEPSRLPTGTATVPCRAGWQQNVALGRQPEQGERYEPVAHRGFPRSRR